jgi:hypothetical protein
MPGNELDAKNELFKFLYNNRTFIKALPVGKYIADENGVDFPSNRKGDSFCYLHMSDATITDLNSLKSKFKIDFAQHSCHLTVYANIDFSAPKTEKPTLCHFTFKYKLNDEMQELRLYYANDGDMVLQDGGQDEAGKAIMDLAIIKAMQKDFSELLAKLNHKHLA